jgi:hypothetical protein
MTSEELVVAKQRVESATTLESRIQQLAKFRNRAESSVYAHVEVASDIQFDLGWTFNLDNAKDELGGLLRQAILKAVDHEIACLERQFLEL